MPKIIIISNRLPVTVEKKSNEFIFKQSAGGLATGLSSLPSDMDYIWIGNPGITLENLNNDERTKLKFKLINNYKCIPVFLSSENIKYYYNGYSNRTIWPLFHYFPLHTFYDQLTWDEYKKVNKIFFNEVINYVKDDDLIWIHDYHLMLLPEFLRKKFPSIKIGFFLHIPFPSYEIFRILPNRKEILDGILGSDLIGFHTYSYVRHFLSSVLRICGYENHFGIINLSGRIIKVDVFPMGIDYDKFHNADKDEKVKKERNELQKKVKKLKVILSIDRADYTKGILQRLEAFDLFLDKYPEYIEKILLIMIAVPSRPKIDSYNKLKNQIAELVGNINGKYSTLGWSPIWYLYKSFSFKTLAALYSVADIVMLTPLRDGMNLVAKEFIACKNNKRGVLILSEMAGVAEELAEALIVNPNNKFEVADSIRTALKMPYNEQANRIGKMQNRLQSNNIFKWFESFIDKLKNINNYYIFFVSTRFIKEIEDAMISEYIKMNRRIFFFDYDGTLTSFKERPEKAKPDAELYSILNKLLSDKKNKIVLISGRDRLTLDKWFGGLNISLVAEHGAWTKENSNEWFTNASLDTEWKKEISNIFKLYVDRTPKSFIEEKDYSIVWHYRNADPDFAVMRLREMKGDLLDIVANLNLGIIDGNKVLEVKSLDINKGKACSYFLNKEKFDFILTIGDDWTDEDMFSAMPENAYSIKVGIANSKAKYWINSYKEVRSLINKIGDRK
ncbi:MAG: bifunctional alpha,alpha-trehalose-phosphate synthase (UDP-forming)/trehalose-phosphatase [Spirochaetes bacterium]|nr:bifunctional alpha,alpha-trehalose-phosphate synthase (UDP-forming)/trehalose-phosphatase [Spirochaetota bacterium]